MREHERNMAVQEKVRFNTKWKPYEGEIRTYNCIIALLYYCVVFSFWRECAYGRKEGGTIDVEEIPR